MEKLTNLNVIDNDALELIKRHTGCKQSKAVVLMGDLLALAAAKKTQGDNGAQRFAATDKKANVQRIPARF
ncbi:hypothetical protein [Thiothrix winogradskyi]|uniref:Uncharacterized protein n=1 Tax=Thiothrix winogradskyi TaxID=96472 RepID=A0ABY3SXM2_9GAMM|nr:hypothetical protein [Thiothrix winogradskyi]UJS23899.1 hypothetical protein L2Y54_18455 [Thiothrix winogradskyi]